MRVKVIFDDGEGYEGECYLPEGINYTLDETTHEEYIEMVLHIRPDPPVVRYRWWVQTTDCGHKYEHLSPLLTEEELRQTYGQALLNYECIEATKTVTHD